jgi:ubiquinone/menaquinone biosynthesis C-methylase UbiE
MAKKELLLLFALLTLRCSAFSDESRRVYAERYPALFKTFLQHTNEKEVDAAYIARTSKLIAHERSNWLHDYPVIYDIGCGDGYLTGLVLKDLHSIVPSNLHYIGIDPQEKFLQQTARVLNTLPWVTPSFKAQRFEQITPDSTAADMILMSQCCYYMHDIPSCINTMKQLMSPQGCTFLIHVDDSALHQLKKKHKDIIESTSVDLLGMIEAALTKADLHYAIIKLPVTLNFPEIADKTWQQLLAVPYDHYDVNYDAFGDDFMCMKNLFELFFEHPLEAFSPEYKKILLEELHEILQEVHYTITISYRMHCVFTSNVPKELLTLK